MTSIALLLAASVAAPLQTSSSSLANGLVWKVFRQSSAGGGNVVCAPTSELVGISSLVAAGIKVPTQAADMAGGDSTTSARLVGSLYSADKAFSTGDSIASSETSVWMTGATTKDGALANFDNLSSYYVNRNDRLTGVEKWLAQRVPSQIQTSTPEVSRQVVTAATYGTQFFPSGENRFAGVKVPFVTGYATNYSEDASLQIASGVLMDNKKFSLVLAAPVGETTMGEVVDKLEKNWREALSGLPHKEITLQFPRFYQTVDRSVDPYLDLKAEDGISVRERLTVSLGAVPIAAKATDRKSTGGGNMGMVWNVPNYIHLAQQNFGAGGFGHGSGSTSTSHEPQVWVVDHPFIFMIADNSTGQIVYGGICNSPAPKSVVPGDGALNGKN